jgi:hypothetical protein
VAASGLALRGKKATTAPDEDEDEDEDDED